MKPGKNCENCGHSEDAHQQWNDAQGEEEQEEVLEMFPKKDGKEFSLETCPDFEPVGDEEE